MNTFFPFPLKLGLDHLKKLYSDSRRLDLDIEIKQILSSQPSVYVSEKHSVYSWMLYRQMRLCYLVWSICKKKNISAKIKSNTFVRMKAQGKINADYFWKRTQKQRSCAGKKKVAKEHAC